MQNEQRKIKSTTSLPEFYDYLKHLTTLSTGSLLLLVTFAEKFAKVPVWQRLFAVGIGCFLISVICSLTCMFLVLSSSRKRDTAPPWEDYAIITSFVLTCLFFVWGILAMSVYGIANVGV